MSLSYWRNTDGFERITFAFSATSWIQETVTIHGGLALWFSYLVQVQAICVRMISYKLSKAMRVSQQSVLETILVKALKDFEQLEGVGRGFNKLYDFLILLTFFGWNGLISTHFAYLCLNLLLEGNRAVVAMSLVSIFIVGHRLYHLSSACSSYVTAAAELQEKLLIIRTTAAFIDRQIMKQVSNRRKLQSGYSCFSWLSVCSIINRWNF